MPVSALAESKSEFREPAGEGMHPSQEPVALNAGRKEITESGDILDPLPLAIDLAQTWLAWQCRMVAGIIRGVLYQPADAGRIESTISVWPGKGEGEQQLGDIASEALQEKRGVIRSQQRYGPGNHRVCDLVACPLLVDNEPVTVIAVMISTRSEAQQQAVLQLIQWGGLWMETLVRQQSAVQQGVGTFNQALLTGIVGHASSHEVAMDTVNRLADRFACERVSMGFRSGLTIRLRALSHVANFDPRTQLVRRIEAAMEEAVDQATILLLPDSSKQEALVTRAHGELIEHQGTGVVCTIPLLGQCGAIGAITLERDSSRPFDTGSVGELKSIARIMGPALEWKLREERSAWSKGIEVLLDLATGVFGPTRLKLKLTLLALLVLVTTLALMDGNYKVTAPASIEGAVRQILVAPQDGYVKQSEVRAGNLVKKGQLIAVLDDRNLQLTRQKWQSERNKIEKEYQEALAKHDRTEQSVLRAQIDQVDAELRLIEEQIARTRIKAPFDGVVVSGDLSQSLGAPVETGQLLFEVAPLDSYRVVLEVDEHDVAGLDSARSGHLIIAALPQSNFAISLDKLVPVAVSGEASNYFRVEASLDEPSSLLRPGMRGVTKVDMGRRNLLWIWTHAVLDRIRLWAWSAGCRTRE